MGAGRGGRRARPGDKLIAQLILSYPLSSSNLILHVYSFDQFRLDKGPSWAETCFSELGYYHPLPHSPCPFPYSFGPCVLTQLSWACFPYTVFNAVHCTSAVPLAEARWMSESSCRSSRRYPHTEWWRRPPAPGLLLSVAGPAGRWRLARIPGVRKMIHLHEDMAQRCRAQVEPI